MAGVYYETYQLPLQVKTRSAAGELAYHPNVAELVMTASTFHPKKGRQDIFVVAVHSQAGSIVGKIMGLLDVTRKDRLDGMEAKRWVMHHLEQNRPVVVNVLINFNSKVEVFTSFLTKSSIQAWEGLVKGKDLSKLIAPYHRPIKSKHVNCANCMHHYKGSCPNEPSVKARLARPLKRCTGCESVFYCSKECQKADFIRGHMIACEVFAWISPLVEKEGTELEWCQAIARLFGATIAKALAVRGEEYDARNPDGSPLRFEEESKQ